MLKVLLVDDETIILKGLQTMINWSELGLILAGTASNGAEALDILEKTDGIDVVVTDIRMPDVDGLMLIRKIRDRSLPIKCIVLSGYSEFEYVKEAAKLGIENYILKPVDKNELITTLVNTTAKIESERSRRRLDDEGIEIIRNNILTRWIKGEIEDDDLQERALMLGLDLSAAEYQVAVAKLLYDSTPGLAAGPEETSMLRLIDPIKECLAAMEQDKLSLTILEDNNNALLLYGGEDLAKYRVQMEAQLQALIERVSQHPRVSVVVAVGSLQKGFRSVHKSYYSAGRLLEHSLIFKRNSIVYHNNVDNTSISLKKQLQIDYNALNTAIRSKNSQEVQLLVQQVFHRMGELEINSTTQLHEITVDLLFYIINTIRTLNYNTDKVFGGYADMLSCVNQFIHMREMELWMRGIITKCMDILSNEDEKISPFIKKILAYLNQNYASEINLSTVADNFGINSFYLGQQFKKETGDTFTNYLNNIRVEQAKYLLLSTNLKAVDIAKKVGYTNTNYFSTIFKKVAGCSPSEFVKGSV